jgi:MarR family transcriptional regulator, 2-MHQ and catechol-resistance regulon repressor
MRDYAIKMSDLTLRLFALCQEREANFVARYDMHVAEFRCLYTLWKNDTISVKKLANLLNNTPSRLTRVIESLRKKELVERLEPDSDRRLKIISLTKKGKKLIEEMKYNYDSMHSDILSEVTDDSHEQILSSIAKLIDAMENWKVKCESTKKKKNN